MELVARQFIRAVRGERSQAAFSRKLRYKGNVVSDWEAGRRFPTASEALRACKAAGIDVPAAIRKFHPVVADTYARGLAEWMEALRGSSAMAEVADRAGRSRYAVGRWLSGRAEPRLPDWLRLVEALTGRLTDLVAELVDIEQVPLLLADHTARMASRRLAAEAPWTEAILRVLETGESDAKAIAARLGISVKETRFCLDLLVQAGVVRAGKVAGDLNVDTRAFPQLRRHWAGVAMSRLEAPRKGDVFSYNVFSVSRADLDRIETLHRAYFREVRRICAESTPTEVAALVNVQLVRFDTPSPPTPPPARVPSPK